MHQSIYAEKANAKGIVIFVHGFLGSPNQFADWADEALDSGYSVASLLLPGHGTDAGALLRINESDWFNHVKKEVDAHCAKHRKVFLVGHSIGGLISLKVAAATSRPLAGICAIAAPVKLNYFSLHSLLSRARLLIGRSDNPIRRTYAASNSVSGLGISAVSAIVHSYLEIRKLMRSVLRGLEHITSPVLLIYSKKDETVSYKSMAMLEAHLPNAPITSLSLVSSLHAYYVPKERAIIAESMCWFLDKHSSSITSIVEGA